MNSDHFISDHSSFLVPGLTPHFSHKFGGENRFKGSIPPGHSKPCNLLFDLDLRDSTLGLSAVFPGLSRMPMFNPLQYNCCDMIYRIMSSNEIRILKMTNDPREWDENFPYQNYPTQYPEYPIVTTILSEKERESFWNYLDPDNEYDRTPDRPWVCDHAFLPRIGGRFEMAQGIPEWDCTSIDCAFSGQESVDGKIVFSVIWERPVPQVHLWDNAPSEYSIGSAQIIFSYCEGCKVIHTCNRCD